MASSRSLRSLPALALLALGATALAGLWPRLPACLLLAGLSWLPGAVVRRHFVGDPDHALAGPGRVAFAGALSLAMLSAVLVPLYVARAPLSAVPLVTGALFVLVATLELLQAVREPAASVRAPQDGSGGDGGDAAEWAACALAVALLLPVLLRYAGGNVDDWWDLAFVRSWLVQGHFTSAEPFLGTGLAHPRFLWSAWLALQAVVGAADPEDLWRVQAGPLAAVVCLAVVSAHAALARALFGRGDVRTVATVLVLPLWLWGTEEVPFFTRAYQDKLVAAFALAPLMLAAVVEALRRPPREGRSVVSVAAIAVATVSVHSLVYTMAVFAAGLLAIASRGRRTLAWLRSRQGLGLAAAMGLPSLYPLAQALWLRVAFGAEGISLAQVDNPVVRAHLALGRILGAGPGWDGRAGEAATSVSPLWIVHPAAVFAPVALLAIPGLVLAVRARRCAHARMLVLLTVVPLLLLFTPGLAAIAGNLWVPWMLYRLAWLVPVAALIGWAVGAGLSRGGSARAAALLLASVAVAMAWWQGADRLRRDMAEHPGPGLSAPQGTALAVYEFLSRGGSAGQTVLAPPGFAELVPALSGKPVVAFTERGTLVFAGDEAHTYRRLRDNAAFFFSDTTAEQRRAIAARYGVRWAVLPRTLVVAGSEERWLRRFGAEALLAAAAADRDGALWSSTRDGALGALGRGWRIAWENRDWLVAERDAAAASEDDAARAVAGDGHVVSGAEARGDSATTAAAVPRWLAQLDVQPPAARAGGTRPPAAVLASLVSAPGCVAAFAPPPQLLAPVAQPIWIGGSEEWENVPAEASITLDMSVPCVVDAVRVIPYGPRPRREALEIAVQGRRLRAQAVHGLPLDLRLDAREPRSKVELKVRSLLGDPVSLADVQLLGDPASCRGKWPAHQRPMLDILEPDGGVLQRLAFAHPGSGRPLVSLAHRASQASRADAARALLVEATVRDPSLVQAWLDLGFHDDDGGRAPVALADYAGALRADSHSAWAHGCAAWASYRAGHTATALWHAMKARSLDPYYPDAWTLLAYVAHRAGLDAVAERCLDSAERMDPSRNWPLLVRVEFALEAGDTATARRLMDSHLKAAPFDEEVRARLVELDRRVAAEAAEK